MTLKRIGIYRRIILPKQSTELAHDEFDFLGIRIFEDIEYNMGVCFPDSVRSKNKEIVFKANTSCFKYSKDSYGGIMLIVLPVWAKSYIPNKFLKPHIILVENENEILLELHFNKFDLKMIETIQHFSLFKPRYLKVFSK